MKVRCDFVSNSSSCSFVIACQSQYLDAIAKDIAKSCVGKKSSSQNKELVARNRRILDFCLNTYQLAFLGSLVTKTEKIIYNLDYFIDLCDNNSTDGENMWNSYKEDFLKAKNDPDCYEWLKRRYAHDEYDADKDEIVHYEDITAEGVVISNEMMQRYFERYHFNDNDKTLIDKRVKHLVEVAEWHSKEYVDNVLGDVYIYKITQDTIDNTRDLINAGHKVNFEKWEDLDSLEAKIKNGDAIFYVRIARDGDGYGDYYIYCEDEGEGIDGVSGIEILTSDSM